MLVRTYNISDGCPVNDFEVTITYSGSDQTPPDLIDGESIPLGETGMDLCEAPVGPTEAEIAALYEDNCGGLITVVKSGTPTGDECSWSVTYTYVVTDECGNPVVPSPTVSYDGGDQSDPVITSPALVACDGSVTVETLPGDCSLIAGTQFDISATDNCDTEVLLSWTLTDANGERTGTGSLADEEFIPGTTHVYWEAEDNCGHVSTCEFDGTVPAFVIPPEEPGYGVTLRATLLHTLTELPKLTDPLDPNSAVPYAVTAEFTPDPDVSPLYLFSVSEPIDLLIVPRKADPFDATYGFYTGQILAWTTGPNVSTGTITLAATIKDNSTPTGDVRGARVTFCYVRSGGLVPIPSAKNLPVGLIDMTDGTVGIASADVQFDIGKSMDAESFDIAVIISGGYFNDLGEGIAVVTVAKPVPGGSILGAGNILNSDSDGQIKGADGELTNFSYDVKYNKKQTNPQGKMTITIRSWYNYDGTLDGRIHTYLVKTNAINLMVLGPSGVIDGQYVLTTGQAIFDAKANISEMQEDGSYSGIAGNSPLHVTMTDNDRVEGTFAPDEIGITYYNSDGGIWFSSNWDWTEFETVEQEILPEGEIVVENGSNEGGGNGKPGKDGEIIDGEVVDGTSMLVYPNPTSGPVTFEFTVKEDANTTIDIYSATGQIVKRAYEGFVKGGEMKTVNVERKLARGFYFIQLRSGDKLIVSRLIVGNRYERN